MITISKNKMKELLIKFMELGLTNPEIAERLNTEYGATDDNRLTAQQVAKYKALVGLKGYKPKKKSLFELVDEEPPPPEMTGSDFDADVEKLQEEFIAENEFITSEEVVAMSEADYYDGDESDKFLQ